MNDVIRNIGNPQAAFGGNGSSGYGRYHGEEGLRTFSRVRTVMTAQRIHNTEVHWFPFRARTFERLRGLLMFRHGHGSIGKRMRAFSKVLVLLSVLFCGITLAHAEQQGSLRLEVTLPSDAHGQIAYLVFAASKGFPNRQADALKHGFVPLADGKSASQQINVGPLPPGRYAVSIYLDLNGNRKLDKTWLGIPQEPVGVSNNPKARAGPPHFDECAFVHGRESETISVRLVQP